MKQTMKSCILEQPDTIRRVCQNAEKVCDSVYSIVGKGPFDNVCNECVLHFELYFYVGDSTFYSRRFFD